MITENLNMSDDEIRDSLKHMYPEVGEKIDALSPAEAKKLYEVAHKAYDAGWSLYFHEMALLEMHEEAKNRAIDGNIICQLIKEKIVNPDEEEEDS